MKYMSKLTKRYEKVTRISHYTVKLDHLNLLIIFKRSVWICFILFCVCLSTVSTRAYESIATACLFISFGC